MVGAKRAKFLDQAAAGGDDQRTMAAFDQGRGDLERTALDVGGSSCMTVRVI